MDLRYLLVCHFHAFCGRNNLAFQCCYIHGCTGRYFQFLLCFFQFLAEFFQSSHFVCSLGFRIAFLQYRIVCGDLLIRFQFPDLVLYVLVFLSSFPASGEHFFYSLCLGFDL